MEREDVLKLLSKQTLMSIATQGDGGPDNSIVCFAFDMQCNLYFGSYSDTLKCKNIAKNPNVAITAGTLQIHGCASIVPYDSVDYQVGREVYDNRFPQYKEIFELENNELYRVTPFVIWNYNPSKGEMYRDSLIFHKQYFDSIEVYEPHPYTRR